MAKSEVQVLTVFNDSYEAGFLCAAVNACYSERHGYAFHPLLFTQADMEVLCEGRHFAWAKVALLRWLYAAESDSTLAASGAAKVLDARLGDSLRKKLLAADWTVWMDADLMVTNHERPLSVYLDHDKDLVLGEDMADLDWLNTGLLACRRSSEWIRELWSKVWREGDPAFHKGEFWDQSALCGCLANWGEFSPDVVGGKKTGAPKPKQPWFSWQGGLRRKKTEHLLVINAGAIQVNNPRFTQFAFHAAGMKDKPRCCRYIIEIGAVQGLAVSEKTYGICNESKHHGWRTAFDTLHGAKGKFAFPWGWPDRQRHTWSNEQPISRMPLQTDSSSWDRRNPAICTAPSLATGVRPWSFAGLAESSCAEDLVEIVDRAPRRASDPPPGRRPLSFSTRVRLWEALDYAAGFPPSQHATIREMDATRLWRTAWRPWCKPRPGQPLGSTPPTLAWPRVVKARADPQSIDDSDVTIEVAPPGAELRTHQPMRGCTDWLLWQLEGVQQVALMPSDAQDVKSFAGGALLPDTESTYSPWADTGAKVLTTVLQAGEALMVPAGWWLSALALRPSLSASRPLGGLIAERLPRTVRSEPSTPQATVKAFIASMRALLANAPNEPRKPLKKTLRSGKGSYVGSAARFNAVCHYDMYRGAEAELVNSTFSECPLALFVGADPSAKPLGDAIRQMQVGERALVAIPQGTSELLAFDLELLAILMPADGADVGFEKYSQSWWTWFEDPSTWRPLAGVTENQRPAVARRCARCTSRDAALECSRCRAVSYCCQQCQREDWPSHKSCCKRLPHDSSSAAPRTQQ